MRQVAFLRSINVGGRRVTNLELIACFEAMGLCEVAAYQAAGNLVFRGEATEASLAAGLTEALGYPVPVISRTLDQVAAIAATDPFTSEEHARCKGKVQVSLLAVHPTEDAQAAVLACQTPDDRLQFVGSELYWLPLGRTTDSELDLRTIERALGLRTTRTQGTLVRLAKKFG